MTSDLDKQVIDALIADLREMDAHEAISLDTWKAAADFIERFADDELTDHNITLHEDGYRYPYRARCSCGWSSTGYLLRANAEDMARAHRRETA